jgi:hypothetical protein
MISLLGLMLLRQLMIFSALSLLAHAMPWLMAVFVRMAITLSAVVADVEVRVPTTTRTIVTPQKGIKPATTTVVVATEVEVITTIPLSKSPSPTLNNCRAGKRCPSR